MRLRSGKSKAKKVTAGKARGKRPLRVNLIGVVLLLVLGLFGRASIASECFCLEDEDDNLRHSCWTQQQGVRTVTHCEDDAGEPYKLDDLSGWTRIEDGEGRCKPCRQGRISVEEGPIRGDDDKQPSEGANDGRAQ